MRNSSASSSPSAVHALVVTDAVSRTWPSAASSSRTSARRATNVSTPISLLVRRRRSGAPAVHATTVRTAVDDLLYLHGQAADDLLNAGGLRFRGALARDVTTATVDPHPAASDVRSTVRAHHPVSAADPVPHREIATRVHPPGAEITVAAAREADVAATGHRAATATDDHKAGAPPGAPPGTVIAHQQPVDAPSVETAVTSSGSRPSWP